MSEQLPKFLAVHFDDDFLEHAAFVETEEKWAQLTCNVSPGDHWDPVLIPIKTAAAAPWLLKACEEAMKFLDSMATPITGFQQENRRAFRKIVTDSIAKATT